MFRIELDQPQNLLTIRYSGHVNPDGTHRCAEEVRVAATKVKLGFRLLVDLTDLRSMEVSCAPHIRNIMDMCNQKGVSEVVRVIPDPKQDIGLQIMSYFHYSGEVRVVTCPNVDEALEQLAK
jgi:anti-anti-sigma regulatory factor